MFKKNETNSNYDLNARGLIDARKSFVPVIYVSPDIQNQSAKSTSEPFLARRFFLVMGLCFGFLMSSSPANASAVAKNTPSFDCGKAETEVEKLICADSDLSQLDAELNEWYRKAIRWQILLAGESVRSQKIQQKEWLERRNKLECRPKVKTPKACLISLYREAIQVWKNRLLGFEMRRACRWPTKTIEDCNFKYIDRLLQQGADLNGYDTFYGHCWGGPLYFEALARSAPLFDYAIKQGANLKLPIRDDCTETQALDGVGAFKFFDEIMLLNPQTDLDTPEYTFKFMDMAILKDSKYSDNAFENIKKLLSAGADVNHLNAEGDNLLAAIFKISYLYEKFPHNYERTLKMLKYLKTQGINVSNKNKEGHNALYYLQHLPYQIDKDYYAQFEQLLTPGERKSNND